MSLLTQTVTVGLLLSVVLSLIVFISLWHEPRMWLHDAPKSLQAKVPPKNAREKRITWAYSAIFLPLFFGVPLASGILQQLAHPELGFWDIFLHAAGIVLVFGLVDLVLIDWLVICYWTPRFTIIPGTEGDPAYKDYAFHFHGFLIGVPILIVTGLVTAAAAAGAAAYLR